MFRRLLRGEQSSLEIQPAYGDNIMIIQSGKLLVPFKKKKRGGGVLRRGEGKKKKQDFECNYANNMKRKVWLEEESEREGE